jgi:antitoxin component of MazEF toxin-antitoxin module
MTPAALPVMTHKLIPVGNSNAIIIPARIIKKHRFTSATEFDIIELNDGIKLVPKRKGLEDLVFPKIKKSELSKVKLDLGPRIAISQEEIQSDDRLKYILSR